MAEQYIEVEKKKVKLLEKHEKNPDYRTDKQQVFIIGSKGIPAAYGGFETFVEKLTAYQKNKNIRYHVARMGKEEFRFEYNGAKCFNVKVPDIGPAKAIYYDLAALQKCIDYCKARPAIKRPIFYVLACRIGPFIHHYKKQIEKLGGVLYVNPDGHEWKRAKWSAPVRKYWKISEKYMVKHADLLICDSKNIEKYIKEDYKQYNPKTTFIAYGSEVEASKLTDDDPKLNSWYQKKGLEPKEYYLMVGRFVPENNFEVAIREFMASDTKKNLAIITTESPKFAQELREKLHYEKDPRVKFVGTVYDAELLKKIRENAFAYIHGHEVGGTNPSLLEALGSTDLNLLLNVNFNQEVGEDAALYFGKAEGDLKNVFHQAEQLSKEEIQKYGEKAKKRIKEAYSWEYIIERYESVLGK